MSETVTSAPAPGAAAAVLEELRFNEAGLVAAIAQQHDTGEVLMLAWMNREAVERDAHHRRASITGRARAGSCGARADQSGQVQKLIELRVDCDGDAVLLLVDQHGVACHTGRHNCFFRAARGDQLVTIADAVVTPGELYGEQR